MFMKGSAVAMMVTMMTTMMQPLHGFSNGKSLVTGDSIFRKVYCQRPALDRSPIHLSPECGGPCGTRDDGKTFFSLDVNETTYWNDGVYVTLQAKEGSDLDVRGFTLFAVDDQGKIVGLFDTTNDEIAIGSCEDVIKNTVEGKFAIHSVSKPGRKKVTLLWKPDGFNHGTVKFGAWVVHNHSTVFYVESHELTSEKNSDEPLDLIAMYRALLQDSQANMAQFEKAFTHRGNMGYQMHLENPFAPFNQPPTSEDLLPKSRMNSDGTMGGYGGFGSPVVIDNGAINSGVLDFQKNRENSVGGDATGKTTSGSGQMSPGDRESDFHLISIGEWMKSRGAVEKRAPSGAGKIISKDDSIIINNLLLVGIGNHGENLVDSTHGMKNDLENAPVTGNKSGIDKKMEVVEEKESGPNIRSTVGVTKGENVENTPSNAVKKESTLVGEKSSTSSFEKERSKTRKTQELNGMKSNEYKMTAPPKEDAIKVRKLIKEKTVVEPETSPGHVNDNVDNTHNNDNELDTSESSTDSVKPKLHFLNKRASKDESLFKAQAMESSTNSRNALDIFGVPSSPSSSSSSASSSSNRPPAWAMSPQMSFPADPNRLGTPNGAANGRNPMMNPQGRGSPNPFMQQGGRNTPSGMNGINPAAMQQQRLPFGQPSQQMPFSNQPRQMQSGGPSSMPFPMPGQSAMTMGRGSGRPSQPFPMGPSGQQPFGSNGPVQMRLGDTDDDNNPFGAAPMNPFQRMPSPGANGQFPQQPGGFGGNPQMQMGGAMGPMMGNQNPMMMGQMMPGMGGQSGFPGSQMGMMGGPGGGMNSPYSQASMGMNGPGAGGLSSNPFSSMAMASMMGRGGGGMFGQPGMNGQSSSPFGFANRASMMGGGMGNFMQSSASRGGMPGMMNPFMNSAMGMSGSSRGGFPGMMPSSMQGMSGMGGMSGMASMYGRSGMSTMNRMSGLMSRMGRSGFGSMAGMGGMFRMGGGMPGMMSGFRGSRSG